MVIRLTFAFILSGTLASIRGQVSLGTVVALAVAHSPRVKLAEDDVRRARAVVTETKDAYIPSLVATGGAGDSYGITLSVPTILTVNAQSLVYSSSQRFHLQAARASLEAALLTLDDVSQRVEEDAVLTYVSLENVIEVQEALLAQYGDAATLLNIAERRLNSGLDSEMELNQVHRQMLGIKLQQLQVLDEFTTLQEHVSGLTGLTSALVKVVRGSIPPIDSIKAAYFEQRFSLTLSERANDASIKARVLHAKGDASYRWRPQIGFAAQYGRVSPINNVSDYYNLHGKYNVAFFGVQIQVPMLDAVHKARATEAQIDAEHAQHEADQSKTLEQEDQIKLFHTLEESLIRAQIAELDFSIAQEQLKATLLQGERGGDGGPVVNPKDEQNVRLQVRQRFLDLLGARLQAQRTTVSLLRITGGLDAWLTSPIAPSTVVTSTP